MITTNTIKPDFNFNDNIRLLSSEVESTLDTCANNITNYIKINNGRGESDDVKNKIYEESQILWKTFSSELGKVKYNFPLTNDQSGYLTQLIRNELEYDINTVFFASDLSTMLDNIKSLDGGYSALELSATEVTYVYHLISKHKVKGLTSDSFNFMEILLLIGKVSKIFDYYNVMLENISTDIKDWVVLFDEGITSDKMNLEISE